MKITQDIHHIWEKFEDEYKTERFLCDLISLALSAIGIFKLFNLNAEKEIYYKEKSHPHVAIRFILIQENMVNYISHIRNSKISDDFKDSMMSNSLSIIDILNKFHKDTFFDNFTKTCIQNSKEITEYGVFLSDQVTKNERCAYYKMKVLENHEVENVNQTVIENIKEKSIIFSDKSTSYIDIADYFEAHITEKASPEVTKTP